MVHKRVIHFDVGNRTPACGAYNVSDLSVYTKDATEVSCTNCKNALKRKDAAEAAAQSFKSSDG